MHLLLLSLILLTARPETDPAFGSGNFGQWTTDRFGLPAYVYTMDERTDPRAEWDPKVGPRTRLMWAQVGNERVNAAAFNDGFVQLFYADSGYYWLNAFEPEQRAYAGGFGWIEEGGKFYSTLVSKNPEAQELRRVFGAGYFEKDLTTTELRVSQVVFAPRGDWPALVSEITIQNLSPRNRDLSYFEYWDLNPKELLGFVPPQLLSKVSKRKDYQVEFDPGQKLLKAEGKKVWGPEGGFPPRPRLRDPELPSYFLAALEGEVSGFGYDQAKIFAGADGWIGDGSGLSALGLGKPAQNRESADELCLVLRSPVTLKPGESKTLRFVFGYAKGQPAGKIVADLIAQKADRIEASAATWRREMPGLTVPESPWMDRELKWDYYATSSASLYDGYYQRHFIPQGGHYMYVAGANGAERDTAAYVQSLIYYRPEQAREILEFIMRSQEPSGRLYYDLEGYGHRYLVPYRPSDLDLWFINAMTEYLFATRDFAFLETQVPFYPREQGESGTVYEHIRRSFNHLVNDVGIGKHGLVKLKFHDWNDEMVFLVCGPHPLDILLTARDGGSTMNTGMAVEILPRFAELAAMRGDMKSAERARAWVEQLLPALREQWRGRYFNRAYSAMGREYGADYIHLESQIWPLLSGKVLSEAQTATLLEEIKTKLIDPSVLGMTISSTLAGKMFTKPGEQEEGGIWPAMNGPAMLALSRYEPGLAWQEFKKNALAWHAETYPQIWFGIWGGPDCWNAAASKRPGETWSVSNPVLALSAQQWPVMNTHSHSQWLWAAARIAGLNPTAQGYVMDPKIPGDFAFSSAVATLVSKNGFLEGSFQLQNEGRMSVKLREPKSPYEILVNGKAIAAQVESGWVSFELGLPKNQSVSWKTRAK